jgi:hypothetical protein
MPAAFMPDQLAANCGSMKSVLSVAFAYPNDMPAALASVQSTVPS